MFAGSLAVTSAALAVVAWSGGGVLAELVVLALTWTAVAIGRFAVVSPAPSRSQPTP